MMTDPVSDMLTRIRNAGRAGHSETSCPSSKTKLAIARVLKDEGFIDDLWVEAVGGKPLLRIKLRYGSEGRSLIDGIRRVSRPSCRVYVKAGGIPRVRNGLGISVLSTNKGVISDRGAREERVGGEILCEVW
jgi:small subunit ribosomal protein S8